MFARQPEPSSPPRLAPPGSPPGPVPQESYDVVDLRDYVDLLVAGRLHIAAVTALVLSAGVGWALLSTPIYEAQALIQVEDQRPSLPGFEQLSGLNVPSPIESEVEILRSRFVLGQVVDRLDLQTAVRPDYLPVFGAFLARRHDGEGLASPRFGARRRAWGGERVRVDRLEVAQPFEGKALTLVAGEDGSYSLSDPQGTLLLEGRVGEAARSTFEVNDAPAVEIFVSELLARPQTRFFVARRSYLRAIESLRGALTIRPRGGGGFLEVTLQGTDPERLRSILDALANTYLHQHVERGSAEARSSLAFLEDQLPEVRAQLEAAEERFNDFRRGQQAVDLSAETQHLLSRIVAIESEMAQIDLQMVEEGQRFAAQHPRMQTLRTKRGRLHASKTDLEQRVEALPERQQEALRLRREVEVATHLYTSLLNTAQELRVVQASTIGNVRIVDHAVAGERPVKPRRSLTAALSLVLGLMLGVGLVFFRQALHRTVDDPDTLEQAIGLPVYTVIPHSRAEVAGRRRARRSGGAAPLLALTSPQDPAVEGLRSFRTSLHFAVASSGKNLIVLTSAHASSGKSFVCANAGHVFAAAGKKVLIVDADLRRGRLHEFLGRDREPGLTDVLAGSAEAADVIETIEGTSVDLITTGVLPPNPSELLMSQGWQRLQADLREIYDLIIVDTPPVLAVTDAAVVGSVADAIFLIVRAGSNRIEEIESAVRRLKNNDLHVTGLLFNDMGATKAGYGARRYQHYYQYDYKNRHGGS